MARKDIIMLSQRELRRLHVISKILEGTLKQVEAGEILSLSDRQIRRLIKRVRLEGDAGVTHKSRGKPSNRSLPRKIKDKAIRLYRKRLQGFGPTLHDWMAITNEGNRLRFKEITERPEKEQKPIIFIFKKRKTYIPPLNHPWRRFKPVIQNNSHQQKELQT